MLVTLSVFAGNEDPQEQYHQGLAQIVDSLPHIARRMDIHLAIFMDDAMFKQFADLESRPHVTLFETSKTGGSLGGTIRSI